MTDQQIRDRVFSHTLGALTAMNIVAWSLAWPMIVANGAWWAR